MNKKKITLLSMIAVTVMVAGANAAFCWDKGERPPVRIKATRSQESLVQKLPPEATLPDEIVCKLAVSFYVEQEKKFLAKDEECSQLEDGSNTREECDVIKGMLLETYHTAGARACQKCDVSKDDCITFLTLGRWN